MQETILIYVAGNPNAYPLEYYNAETESYQGVLPELLYRFSKESQYQISYTHAGEKDRRAHLAENRQVDILSGYRQGDAAPPNSRALTVFLTLQNGQETAYQLYISDAAPESLQADLEAFFASTGQETISGIVMQTAAPPAVPKGFRLAMIGLILLLLSLAAAIVVLVRRYRKKLKRAEEGLETDETTGLGNLDYFTRYYRQRVNDRNRLLYHLIYFYVDTDRLRRLGSSGETDEFLRYCAVVLQEYTADTDILARVSDHGIVLLRFSGTLQATESWIGPIFFRIRAFSKTYGKPFEVSLSAGIYMLKANDRDLNEMIFSASQGAYAADRNHADYEVCSDTMLGQLVEERRLQAGVERALQQREFQLYIQFYVDAGSYQIVGGEALSRWRHPEKGILGPDRFVPLLEREGAINKLDYYCLNEVCAFLDNLNRSGVDTFFISCNFSRETFAEPDFVENCKRIIGQYCFAKELLILEITESAAVRNNAQLHRNAEALKQYGVSIALDDFGEGFTSFYDLQQYPVDGIKLDKSLVDQVLTEKGKAVLRAMIQVGHELDLTILAEGVETDAQVGALQALQCDVIQGFRFYHPLPQWEAKDRILEQWGRA